MTSWYQDIEPPEDFDAEGVDMDAMLEAQPHPFQTGTEAEMDSALQQQSADDPNLDRR